MAKEIKKEKKEKKEKKPKQSESNGISKTKSEKKEKKEKKRARESIAGEESDAEPSIVAVAQPAVDADGDISISGTTDKTDAKTLIVGASVPFANPMADEKAMKKVLKGVKKSAKNKTLRRGVKEVVKSLRKSATNPSKPPHAIVVLAADISPFDVISHIPVLCEDHHVPYIYVPSRAELGAAGSTKRPTSVVMIVPTIPAKRKAELEKEGKDDKEDWSETYADLAKVVEKAGRDVRI